MTITTFRQTVTQFAFCNAWPIANAGSSPNAAVPVARPGRADLQCLEPTSHCRLLTADCSPRTPATARIIASSTHTRVPRRTPVQPSIPDLFAHFDACGQHRPEFQTIFRKYRLDPSLGRGLDPQ